MLGAAGAEGTKVNVPLDPGTGERGWLAALEVVEIATRIGRWDLAERHLRRLLAAGYQPARTHFALGRVAQAQGRRADAETHYREALRLEPGLAMAVDGLRSLGVR